MGGLPDFPANAVHGRSKAMGYSRLWVITGMGYDRFDCNHICAADPVLPLAQRVFYFHLSSLRGPRPDQTLSRLNSTTHTYRDLGTFGRWYGVRSRQTPPTGGGFYKNSVQLTEHPTVYITPCLTSLRRRVFVETALMTGFKYEGAVWAHRWVVGRSPFQYLEQWNSQEWWMEGYARQFWQWNLANKYYG